MIQDKNAELKSTIIQKDSDILVKCGIVNKLITDIENLERACIEDADNKSKICQLQKRIVEMQHEFQKQEDDFDEQIKELNKETSSIINQVRQNAIREKNDLDAKIITIKSEHDIYENTIIQREELLNRKIEVLGSQIVMLENSENDTKRIYKTELKSTKDELLRLSTHLENQQESHKASIGILESRWKDDITEKKKELDSVKCKRHMEKLDSMTKLRSTESELIASKTLLKENKRRLADIEERENKKKQKNEQYCFEEKLARSSSQLEYMETKQKNTQHMVTELEKKNTDLKRLYKDAERKREIDILKIRYEYEKQLSS